MKFTFKKTTTQFTVTSAALAVLAASLPAQAVTFVPFSFTTNVTASPPTDPASGLLNDPTKDILLDSVVSGGKTTNLFEVVTGARILQNDTYNLPDGTTYGILNSGRGPNTVSDPLTGEGPSNPVQSGADIVGSLGEKELLQVVAQQIGVIVRHWQLHASTERQQQILQSFQECFRITQQAYAEEKHLERTALQQIAFILNCALAILLSWLPGQHVAKIIPGVITNNRFAIALDVPVLIQAEVLIQWALATDGLLTLSGNDLPPDTKKWLNGTDIGQIHDLGIPTTELAQMRFGELLRQLYYTTTSMTGLLKLEQWQLVFSCETMPIASLFKRSLERIDHLIKQQKLWVGVHGLGSVGDQESEQSGLLHVMGKTTIAIAGDIVKIELILHELLLGACHRSPTNSRIDIWCRCLDERFLEVSITDNGIIDPQLLQELHLDTPKDLLALLNLNQPPGLHLLICQNLMQKLGGELQVYQLPDNRVVSRLLLPLVCGNDSSY